MKTLKVLSTISLLVIIVIGFYQIYPVIESEAYGSAYEGMNYGLGGEIDSSTVMKFIFSLIFCFPALRVIMAPKEKYDESTRQWAFSILTLIAGVWIGTATK